LLTFRYSLGVAVSIGATELPEMLQQAISSQNGKTRAKWDFPMYITAADTQQSWLPHLSVHTIELNEH
jgi:hypothetical protein